jgi:multisubunit Na+/H+ antiporter MnhG subunit
MERQALRIAILLAGAVPMFGGAVGVLRGQRAFGPWAGAAEDSHMRYLSGLLMAIGLIFWACIPTIERRGRIVRVLTLIVVVGGLSRLAGVLLAGDPGPMRWTLVMELLVTPLLCLWQARVAREARRLDLRASRG